MNNYWIENEKYNGLKTISILFLNTKLILRDMSIKLKLLRFVFI